MMWIAATDKYAARQSRAGSKFNQIYKTASRHCKQIISPRISHKTLFSSAVRIKGNVFVFSPHIPTRCSAWWDWWPGYFQASAPLPSGNSSANDTQRKGTQNIFKALKTAVKISADRFAEQAVAAVEQCFLKPLDSWYFFNKKQVRCSLIHNQSYTKQAMQW